jgi:hypothetical protein
VLLMAKSNRIERRLTSSLFNSGVSAGGAHAER